mgnify:CR=1 FL=1
MVELIKDIWLDNERAALAAHNLMAGILQLHCFCPSDKIKHIPSLSYYLLRRLLCSRSGHCGVKSYWAVELSPIRSSGILETQAARRQVGLRVAR